MVDGEISFGRFRFDPVRREQPRELGRAQVRGDHDELVVWLELDLAGVQRDNPLDRGIGQWP